MERHVSALSEVEHDLVVVGGGLFGACLAWEGTSRGLSVALVEKGDFCSATSANHLKVVHGGIRYLQHLDLRRVRESCRERSVLLRIAPHLVQPLPILMPTYGRGLEGRFVLNAGLRLYDVLTFDRNSGLSDVDRRIPAGRMLSPERCLELCPDLETRNLSGAGLFYDGQFYNPPRLVLAFLHSAAAAGAHVANYVEATGFIRRAKRIHGIVARDRITGDELTVRGRLVINAAGPWAAGLLDAALRIRLHRAPMFSRDAGFAIRGRRTGNHAVAYRVHTKDPDAVLSRKGRHVFLIPWRDYTLVGVWHVVHTRGPEDFKVSEDDLQRFIDEINAADAGLRIRRDEISMVYAGLTLFGENSDEAKDLRFGHRSMLIDHAKEHDLEGLITLIGVRATMARGVAERAVDLAVGKLVGRARPSRTAVTRIHGGSIESFEDFVRGALARHAELPPDVVRSLAHNYGSELGAVLNYASAGNEHLARTLGKTRTLGAEVIYALREEMAQSLADVVLRRTDLGTGGDPGEEALEQCARIAAEELGWNERRVRDELAETRRSFPDARA
jgi:glycerol-3-phosphate dehydrogenase